MGALGLGISSHDSSNTGLHGDSKLPICGLTQLLSSAMDFPPDSEYYPFSSTFAASSEPALGGDGGGFIVFLRNGLQNAVKNSPALQNVLASAVRRSVRILAAVEHSSDVSSSESEDGEATFETKDINQPKDDEVSVGAPDARLASFFTGLLLSTPVQDMVKHESRKQQIHCDLFEAWSIGLLSASAPWRMVCALTASGILNLFPHAIFVCTRRLPTLHRFIKGFKARSQEEFGQNEQPFLF